jgi:iron complex outermembrane receptor protein
MEVYIVFALPGDPGRAQKLRKADGSKSRSVMDRWQGGNSMSGTKALLLAGAMVGVLAGEVHAQEAENPDMDDTIVLGEILVTAQRREETLQDVPLAVTALSGEELQTRGLNDMRDVLVLTPGTAFTSYNAAEPVLSIRGISSGGEGAASDSGVLMLIDGEVISRDFLRSVPLFDVERVEVLRGPQGTTYGRNATGGVFHLISRRPGDEFGGEISAAAGDYGALTLDAGIDLPIGPTTLSRLAVQYSRRDGYSKDVATGRDVDDRESLAGRLTIEQQFGDKLTNTVRLHASRERHGDTAPLKAYDPALPILSGPFRPAYTEPSTDPREIITTPGGAYFDRDIWGVSNELVIELGWSKLTSLTAYRSGKNTFFQSSPLAYNNIDTRNKADVLTQEFRLEGSAADDKVGWVTGVFLLDEDVKYGFDRFGGAATTFPPTTQQLRQVSSGSGYGVFGEINWNLTPELKLAVGGRYSRDEKDFNIDSRAQGPFAPFFVEDPSQPLIASVSDSWGKPTGRVSLQYRPGETFMVYGAVSQGYKSGGFNSEPLNLDSATTPFDEETVLNVEAGVRSQLFNNRMMLNVTAFDMSYDDIQVSAFNINSIEIISNAASASIQGLEVEASVRPNRFLTLSLGASAYDGKFEEYTDINGDDLSGFALAKMPDWTLSVSAVAETPRIADAGILQLRADYATRSDIAHDAPADPLGIREGREMVDLRLAWLPDSERWEAALFVRNLLDEDEKQYIFPQGILDQRLVSYGPPRTIGVSLSYNF